MENFCLAGGFGDLLEQDAPATIRLALSALADSFLRHLYLGFPEPSVRDHPRLLTAALSARFFLKCLMGFGQAGPKARLSRRRETRNPKYGLSQSRAPLIIGGIFRAWFQCGFLNQQRRRRQQQESTGGAPGYTAQGGAKTSKDEVVAKSAEPWVKNDPPNSFSSSIQRALKVRAGVSTQWRKDARVPC